ncbi:hypothetical protein AVDCRST_MAG82-3392 [uncultured Rubrobacteraceae bacterium]|uniref:Uncharacterized protein n=1 Tax=uncultured Rubrobacteraceae bacterium TaxID=349277 RepID=A0A6J4QJ80_9ACTN|nr:hypothetical protein AVDCRST_MAG82-3392 [uncultured Rubrobacteraceae bacterium]
MKPKDAKPMAAKVQPSYRRLRGRWLLVARVVWLAVTVVSLGLFALSLQPGYALLRTVCEHRPCGPEQLSPEGARTIEQLGLSLDLYAAYNVALVLVFALAFCGLAVVIFWRRSNDFIALYTSLTLVVTGIFLPEWTAELLLPIYPALYPALAFLTSLTFCSLFILFYIFPDGRFVPRWTRWTAVVWVGLQAPNYLLPDSPIAPTNWPPLLSGLLAVGLVCTCLFAQVYRYLRVSGPTARQQSKWVVFGLTATLVVMLLASVPPLFEGALDRPGTLYSLVLDLVSFFAALLVPLTLGIAILRRRLFDVDVLINRVLVYGLLTATLVVLYVGAVVALQTVLRILTGQESQLAVAGSTLVIAALFNPIRHHIQAFIDRRFYRRKYDAARTLREFSGALRDEVELDALAGRLVGVVEETVQPAHVSLWLRPPGRVNRRDSGSNVV